MKKILLLSDTHGYLGDDLLPYIQECDEIWHAGDWGNVEVADRLAALKPLRGVWGNIDGRELRVSYPENNIFFCEGVKVLMTHIAGYPGHYTARARQLIRQEQPGIVICGHSHILKVMYDKQLSHLHLNPGAAGIKGFHQVRTMLRFFIQDATPGGLQVIELGKRF